MAAHMQDDDMASDSGGARVRQRLRALRSRYPGLSMSTEIAHLQLERVVVRAILVLPDGTTVTAHAAEPTGDAADTLDAAIERAEWRATMRSLELLGVGDFGSETRRSATPRTVPDEPDSTRHSNDDPTNSLTESEGVVSELIEVVSESAELPSGDLDMASYTWTHLWSWARAHGVSTKSQVEERIGRSMVGMSPHEIHQALREAGLPEP